MDSTETRQHIHSLVDRLPLAQLAAIEELLSVILEPVARSLAAAPLEDEEISEEDAQAIRSSREWFNTMRVSPSKT
ncbi:MAG: hypothetical protein M3Y57_09980 [Acidobacteriota bacterium]|nr:hypothetical protein [Acidobacteriota bacterium]